SLAMIRTLIFFFLSRRRRHTISKRDWSSDVCSSDLLVSVAFTSIMYFFNVCLGKVGSFLMLIFMVVQLAGSAGTYPVELSPGFVDRIHNLVPFTCTVNVFLILICAGVGIAVRAAVMMRLNLV